MEKDYNGRLLEMVEELNHHIKLLFQLSQKEKIDCCPEKSKDIQTKIKGKNIIDFGSATNILFSAITHIENILCRRPTDEEKD